ncbi:MAG TPA: FAD-dependent oxidoreductase [Bryobacteraceae bacterium]|nr:FAD-dependent oxidoreductase [Bryobacteraceae bacterium]
MPVKNEFVNRRAFLKGSAAAGALMPQIARADTAPAKWDKEVDIAIVGTGHAGLAAAIAATDAGAKVVILEKMKKEFEGGNSKVSGNMWWTPTDLPQALQYIGALSYGLTDKECIQALAEEMLKLNDWLATLNIKHTPLGIFQPEHPELPGAACVRTWSNSGSSDGRLYIPLRAEAEKRNVEVLYETPAKALVQMPSREIAGIRAEVAGKPYFIKARKAVILCCGGFEFDFDMQKQFLPGWPIYGQGSPGNTGDGVRMAQQAGAALWHMNNPLAGLGGMVVPEFAPVVIPISMAGAGYIHVDKFGKRFMNENRQSRHGFGVKEFVLYFDGIAGDFTRLPCFTVFDETTRLRGPLSSARKFGWFGWHSGYEWSRDNSQEIEKGWILKGDTPAELAAKLSMKPEDLQATLTRYNENCKNGADPDFDRPKQNLTPIEKPPFYAVKIYPTMVNTQGGPRRNAKCQVVDPFDQPIPRLFTAGELGSFWGWMYNGGGNNAECLCTGQIAARNAVALTPLA